MKQEVTRYPIGVTPPKLHPQITSVGYGNPRYNSMLILPQGILLCSGCHLRLVDPHNNLLLSDQQIGFCQIFQIMQNSHFILVVNYDGMISLLDKNTLKVLHQFYAPGKEIRHLALTDQFMCLSCELLDGTEEGMLVCYRIDSLQKAHFEPFATKKGRFYFPEYLDSTLTLLQYHDPNPKGRQRKETVMTPKLPITNQLIQLDLAMNTIFTLPLTKDGEIICCCQNKGQIYYLHSNKQVSIFLSQKQIFTTFALNCKSFPHLIEPYQQGIIYPSQTNQLQTISWDPQTKDIQSNILDINSPAIGGNLALKLDQEGIYSLNEQGLHFYSRSLKKTHSLSIFNITNCGVVFNQDASMFAVADFGGSFFVFQTPTSNSFPDPLFSVFIGIPIRSLAWCPLTNTILIGCVGGGLYTWHFGEAEALYLLQMEHTVNIIRATLCKFFVGSSDGTIVILDAETLQKQYQFQAHSPIHYETEEERQLFGSMKNYAEIWSLAVPLEKNPPVIVSSCQDQTEKVFTIDPSFNSHHLKHHLKGHQLAVTSVDWKQTQIGQIYVSCSDDKIIRFRDPNQEFKIIYQVQTSTIKQWHTLTYLALQPMGTRLAVGSQNGYLFIWDIKGRELLFGEKVHLGGIQGLDWRDGRVITCSSDLCVNIFSF